MESLPGELRDNADVAKDVTFYISNAERASSRPFLNRKIGRN